MEDPPYVEAQEISMKKSIIVLVLLAVAFSGMAFAQAAPELKIDYQYNVTGPDAGNYFLFSGPVRYMDSGAVRYEGSGGKDTVGSPDATSHASKYHSTEFFNHYQYDFAGKKVIPAGLRGLFLYPVAVDAQRTIDGLKVLKNADGSLTVRYVHRGSAYEFATDKDGNIAFPTMGFKMRQIGHTDNVISPDFSSDGKLSGVDWAKVWNASIAEGKQVGTTASKTGKVSPDMPDPAAAIGYQGALKATFDGKVLKIAGTLQIVKK
jgi:hypothetical protein